MERTDEQKIQMAPFDMTFGEKKYSVKVLRMGAAGTWRAELNKILGPIADNWQSTNGRVSTGLADALLKFPEELAKLIFLYAPDLPEEEIREKATEEQFSVAFQDLMVVAYPFLAPLATVIRLIRPSQSR